MNFTAYREAKRTAAEKGRFFCWSGINVFESMHPVCGHEYMLMGMALDPDWVKDMSDTYARLTIELQEILFAEEGYPDGIWYYEDMGYKQHPFMSPRMYREFFMPRHAAMWARAKQLAPVKVMLHCCGAVRPLLPSLIEAGLDAINPVQISCKGMEAAGLKRDFGRDLTFWGGGCDTQRILPCGTPDEVRALVRHQCEVLAPGGGFVFQQVHNILANVPPENIVAMFDAVNAAGVHALARRSELHSSADA